jgi:carbon-monoxide dehydrogenase catalytic subunit
MTGSKLVTKVLTEDMVGLTGGRVIIDPDGKSAADKLEGIILEKRKALNI